MKTVLIVEDDHNLQDMYTAKISQSGHNVVLAATVMEADHVLTSTMPDLIILDIMLPGGKNGFDFLESIKSQDKYKKIPVVVLTNLDSEEKVAKEIGAQEYMVKAQTDIEDIARKVDSLLT